MTAFAPRQSQTHEAQPQANAYCSYALGQFRSQSLRTLLDAAGAVVCQPQQKGAERLVQLIRDAVSVGQVSVMLVHHDESGDYLEVAAAHGHDASVVGRRVMRGEGVAWRVVERGHDLHLAGVFTQHEHYREHRCSAVVPITNGRTTIGTLNINRREGGLGTQDFLWVVLVANVMGRALELSRVLGSNGIIHPGVDQLIEAVEAGVIGDSAWDGLASDQRYHDAGQHAERLGFDDMSSQVMQAAALCNLSAVFLPATYRDHVEAALSVDPVLPLVSSGLLSALGESVEVCELVRFSGERWDGQGPLRLGGQAIPLPSLLVSIIRALHTPGQGAEFLREHTGSMFFHELVEDVLANEP